MENFIPGQNDQNDQKKKTLAEMGVILEGCYTCQDGSCSANVTYKETGEDYSVYIRRYPMPDGATGFYVDARPSSNTSEEQRELEYHFKEEDALASFLCSTFSGFKCF